jgi:hypothetical protein
MKIKDDSGKYNLSMIHSVVSVSMNKRENSRSIGGKKKKTVWHLEVQFSRDVAVYLSYKNKAEANATYKKIVKVVTKEQY